MAQNHEKRRFSRTTDSTCHGLGTAQRLLEAKIDSELDYDTPVEDEDEHDDGSRIVKISRLNLKAARMTIVL